MDSGSLSRQNSAGSMTTMTTNQMSKKKTSQTNLSEASADTGIMGDIDNKVLSIRSVKKEEIYCLLKNIWLI